MVQLTDIDALKWGAGKLGVTPDELGSVIALESGFNPKVWGGDKGKYYGLIQFGPEARKETGLNPDIHNTIASQMPYVVKYYQGRGFNGSQYKDPSERQMRLYNTVLGGNPNANPNAKDSFGTSANSVLNRMLPGGDLRKMASTFIGTPQQVSSPQKQGVKPTMPQPQQSFQNPIGQGFNDAPWSPQAQNIYPDMNRMFSQPTLNMTNNPELPFNWAPNLQPNWHPMTPQVQQQQQPQMSFQDFVQMIDDRQKAIPLTKDTSMIGKHPIVSALGLGLLGALAGHYANKQGLPGGGLLGMAIPAMGYANHSNQIYNNQQLDLQKQQNVLDMLKGAATGYSSIASGNASNASAGKSNADTDKINYDIKKDQALFPQEYQKGELANEGTGLTNKTTMQAFMQNEKMNPLKITEQTNKNIFDDWKNRIGEPEKLKIEQQNANSTSRKNDIDWQKMGNDFSLGSQKNIIEGAKADSEIGKTNREALKERAIMEGWANIDDKGNFLGLKDLSGLPKEDQDRAKLLLADYKKLTPMGKFTAAEIKARGDALVNGDSSNQSDNTQSKKQTVNSLIKVDTTNKDVPKYTVNGKTTYDPNEAQSEAQHSLLVQDILDAKKGLTMAETEANKDKGLFKQIGVLTSKEQAIKAAKIWAKFNPVINSTRNGIEDGPVYYWLSTKEKAVK